jgi:tetratricopeptide (TPR) repeat protein
LRRAEADAEKAVALAPEEAEGYASRGFIRSTLSWDWAGAQADFAKALLLDPASATVQHSYARLLMSQGRLPEAIATERKAIELDPLSSTDWRSLGRYLTDNRDYRAAGEALRRALEIQPESTFGLYNLARLQLLEGQGAEALATYRKIDYEAFRLHGIAMAEHTLGQEKESQQALDELVAKHAQEAAYQIAEVFAWRGGKDRAFEWLERAYQQRDGGLSSMEVDPLLDSSRGDPRFKALLRKMNLPE